VVEPDSLGLRYAREAVTAIIIIFDDITACIRGITACTGEGDGFR
jgi:hypothetical protein